MNCWTSARSTGPIRFGRCRRTGSAGRKAQTSPFNWTSGDEIEVFTTRPDTLWGATFLVLAPEHPLVEKLTTPEQHKEVEQYKHDTARRNEISRQSTETEKTGVFTGGHATNPVNGEQIPVWIADYVLMSYGTGAIMAVPAHDERDFAFALKYGLPIVPVIARPDGLTRAAALESMLEDPASFEVALTEGEFVFDKSDTRLRDRLWTLGRSTHSWSWRAGMCATAG